jgi:hypothetical protein
VRRHPRTILKCYKIYLAGIPDEEILTAEISASDIQKSKKFNTYILEGKSFYLAGKLLGIDKHIAKRMFAEFEKKQAGLPLLCDHPSESPRITYCFSLILDGASDSELHEKCTEYEIEKAKEFMGYVDADMLSSTIAQQTGLLRSTIKSLLKIYRDKQSAVSLPSGKQHNEGCCTAK